MWDSQEVPLRGEGAPFTPPPFLRPASLNDGMMTRTLATNMDHESCTLEMGQNQLEEA